MNKKECLRFALETEFKPRFDQLIEEVNNAARNFVEKEHREFLRLLRDPSPATDRPPGHSKLPTRCIIARYPLSINSAGQIPKYGERGGHVNTVAPVVMEGAERLVLSEHIVFPIHDGSFGIFDEEWFSRYEKAWYEYGKMYERLNKGEAK